MTIGHRKRWIHSLSGLEASQIPEAIMGIEQRSATKFKMAVMLLLTAMVVPVMVVVVSMKFKLREERKIENWGSGGGRLGGGSNDGLMMLDGRAFAFYF